MTFSGLQMFMSKLNQHLINCNDNPMINNPSVLSERPQFQLLHEELDSMFQLLFNDDEKYQPELEELINLKKRFRSVAEEAEDIVDLFLSSVHFREVGFSPRLFKTSLPLNLDNVMSSIISINVEFMTMDITNSSKKTVRLQKQYTAAAGGTCGRRKSQRSMKLVEEVIVGLELDVQIIRDKLVEDEKKLDVVSIVGTGGIGKTTLATKIFNDRFVMYHFHVRVWVTVSQTYEKRDVLIQILASMGVQLDLEKVNDSKLREMLHKSLMDKRYLIVIDDIWSIEAWDSLKVFFPQDNTGSRLLLTGRLTEVASHAKSHGFIHRLNFLTEKESWKLLCEKVFHGDECPKCLIEPGMKISKSCHGLPVVLVVIAGILEQKERSKDFWEKIASSVDSYIFSDQNGCLETLALSYHHLPYHLRDCFLYFGAFPEDFKFNVKKLIWLWVAEGFIQQDGNRSIEEIAEGYLIDLIDRNLVIVSEWKYNGGLKACTVHDLVREVCLKKAIEERFFLKIDRRPLSYQYSTDIKPYRQSRVFVNRKTSTLNFATLLTPDIQSLLCSHGMFLLNDVSKYINSFALLTVLDIQTCKLNDFPTGMELLLHLRYLAIWILSAFPSSICKLWSLQTLIFITSDGITFLPSNISDLVNLRHLWSNNYLYLHCTEKPMNLQTISNVVSLDGLDNFHKRFPFVKELTVSTTDVYEEIDFESLAVLRKLKLGSLEPEIFGGPYRGIIKIIFPCTLKELTLVSCRLPWSAMSNIQSLPNLEVLKLKCNAFKGSRWNVDEQQFRQLKYLKLVDLDIEHWQAYCTSFPCLRKLEILQCQYLEEIPLDIGNIPTLEFIKIDAGNYSVVESVRRIREEQHAVGNYELEIVNSIDLIADDFIKRFYHALKASKSF